MKTTIAQQLSAKEATKTRFAFMLATFLFFLEGFFNSLNPILIPHLKKAFTLTTTQSILVDVVVLCHVFISVGAGHKVVIADKLIKTE